MKNIPKMLLLLPMMLMSSMESAVKGQNSHRDPCTNRCHQVLLCWSYPYLSIIYLKLKCFTPDQTCNVTIPRWKGSPWQYPHLPHLDAQGKADAWCGERRRSPDGRVMRCVEGSRCLYRLFVNCHNHICGLSNLYLWIVFENITRLSNCSGQVRCALTVAQQKTRIISGVGPMLISGVSLGKFYNDLHDQKTTGLIQPARWER